jgi:hypothetical protein
MQEVTVKLINGKTRKYPGVIGFQAGNYACDMQFFDGTAKLIPYLHTEYVKRKSLTDDEILNHSNKKFAAWYKDQLDKAKKRMEAEEAAANAAEDKEDEEEA